MNPSLFIGESAKATGLRALLLSRRYRQPSCARDDFGRKMRKNVLAPLGQLFGGGAMAGRFGVLIPWVSLMLACASKPSADPTTPDSPAEATDAEESASEGGPSTWSEAEPLRVSHEPARRTSKRMGSVLVQSDPEQHGPGLTFRFAVNGLTIDGVFSVPGGRTSTFRLPAGVVTFTVDECSAGEGGFELEQGGQIRLACRMTDDGDCCDAVIDDPPPPEDAEETQEAEEASDQP